MISLLITAILIGFVALVSTYWGYKRARGAQQHIPQVAKNPQWKLKQAIYKLADSKVIRFLKWLVDDPG